MSKNNKKYKKRIVFPIIIASVVAVVVLSLIITNCFIPVKYLSAYFTIANNNEDGEMRVSFVDVGYGDCTIVEFPDGKTLVIDGGDGTYSNNLKVLKALNKRGIKTIDYLMCSSVSKERCGGLTDILRYKNVLKVFEPYCPFSYVTEEYRSFAIELRERGFESEKIEYGKGVFNDEEGFAFCVLSPSAESLDGGEIQNFYADPSETNINNASAVVWIEFCGHGFLLTGNAEAKVVDKLVNNFAVGVDINGRKIDVSACSVITLPKHGAAISNLNKLLEITKPSCAVLSVGNNGRGYPSAITVSDAQNSVGENFFRTDENGTVTFTVSDGALRAEKEKR